MSIKLICIVIVMCHLAEVRASFIQNNPTDPADYVQRIHSQMSNLNIRAFCQDSLGYMWIATFRGLNRYNGYEFIQYFHDKNDSLSLGNDLIISLFIDSSHRLWIGTATGVNLYDFATDTFSKYPATQGIAYIYSFYEDHSKRVWVATSIGPGWIDTTQRKVIMDAHESPAVHLFMEDESQRLWMGLNDTLGLAFKNGQLWERLAIPGNRRVICIFRDPRGIWWLGTSAGLVLFDPIAQTFKEPPETCRQNYLLNHTQINFIKEITPFMLLIGTESQGIFQYDIPTQTLLHNEPQPLGMLGSDQLLSCYVDRQENVWIGSFDRGFSVWKRYLDYFNPDPVLSNTFRDKFVTRILEDVYGNLWISTRYHGLFHYTPFGKLTRYNAGNSNLFKDNHYLIESLFIDSKNRIWIGLSEELLVGNFTRDGQLVIRERKKVKGAGTMVEDPKGRLWVGATSGLYRLTSDNRRMEVELVYRANVPDICVLSSGDMLFSSYNEGVFRIPANGGQPERFSIQNNHTKDIASHCITIFEDSRQRLWLGSYGNGLLCLSKGKQYILTRSNGLPSNDVLCFREDRQGDMWMSTSYGISRLRITDTTFVNYFSNDGTLGNQFHEKAGLRHSDGRIFFTGNHGLTFFNPAAMLPNKYPPQVHLDDLKIMNQSVKPAPKGSVLKQSIAFTKQITLNHQHSTVSFDYSGIDFLAPQKLTYAYKLEGFDKDWNYMDHFRRATYSNLASGEYTFMVKAINGDGVESLHPATLRITVKPAPWFSWQAIVLYFIILVTGAFLLFRLWFRIKLSKQLLEMEHSEREREKQIAEMKMTFFTNISHELRTPLTLISAPLERLLAQKSLDNASHQLLSTISRNVQRLLRLMNQLLDFRKMESGMLALRVASIDIIFYIQYIREAFIYQAGEKQVALTFEPHTVRQEMWVDTDKLEKILHNLLSNALKYTPQKGSVDIFTQELTVRQVKAKYRELKDIKCNRYMEIIVSDSGPGIPAGKLGELFVQYRQIEGSSGLYPDYGGSGIGLYYTKRLVEAHSGSIVAINQCESGMAFSFVLPLEDVYRKEEKDPKKETVLSDRNIHTEIGHDAPVVSDNSPRHPYTILIVEDNIELMAFIRTVLEEHYQPVCAVDGNEAWKLVQNEAPDLILSDVLMPGWSGYQLCQQVKQHPAFSHIPVILLTAKSSIDDQIEGLEHGADMYICKPFHVEYLLLTIANLLKSRETLRQYFSTPQSKDETEVPIKLNEIDQVFLNRLTQFLEKELDNSELNINSIARNLGFSRTGFYRKLKGLTDMSPLDFFRNYRLRRAAEMIREGTMPLNEVAEKTGFGTYSYFSVIFKKHFGFSPRDYGQK